MRTAPLLALLALTLAGPGRAADPPGPDPKGVEFFESRIRPALVRSCLECHTAGAKVKGGLALDTRGGLLRGGDTGPAVVPGKPADGTLLRALRHDGDVRMPPKEKLPAAVVADFEAWVRMGAPDPRDAAAPAPKYYVSVEEGRKFWSFRPPKKVAPPAVADAAWPWSDVDRFVLAGLEAKGLKPVDDADPLALLRRLHFDLIGLPPSPDDVAAFRAAHRRDPRAAAEAEVDRLLASPHFGEKWGRHWLDVVRYADSAGGQGNAHRPAAWHYRDWVIRAVNADKPYAEFLAEQLAGDLLPAKDAADRRAKQVATGFYALGIDDGTVFDQLEDQVTMIGAATVGLTVACARCHDHKFDPVPQKDYYAFAGMLANAHEEPLGGDRKDRDAPRVFADGPGKNGIKGRPGQKFVDLRVHVGGDEKNLGEAVKRGSLQILSPGRPPAVGDESGRRQFAESLAAPDHPLAARVAVNRVWAHLFGRGLVATVDNFGFLGEKPSHPELLDHLAVTFREDGWSVKRLVRRLVLTRAYGLASGGRAANEKADPDNVWVWRHPVRRLDAEAVRDALLVVGGRLDRTPPGGDLAAKVRLGRAGVVQALPASNHRSVYLPVIRRGLYDFQTVFDFADPGLPTARRETSTVPTQALYFLNSPLVMDQAAALADRLTAAPGDDRARLDRAYLTALGRPPAADEAERDLKYLAADAARRTSGPTAWAMLCHALLASAEFRFVR